MRATTTGLLDRFTSVAATAGPDRAVLATPGWTVRDVTAHLVTAVRRYATGPAGGMARVSNPADLPALNEQLLREAAWPPFPDLLTTLHQEAHDLLDQVDGYGEAQPSYLFNGDRPVRADAALGILVGELAVHGGDVAALTARPWPIGAQDLDVVLRGLEQILPGWVDPARCHRHTATYRLRPRGGEAHVWTFRNGQLSCDAPGAARADCTVAAQPAALLQVMYRRRSPWRAASTGAVLAWGRRPWLALTLADRFFPP